MSTGADSAGHRLVHGAHESFDADSLIEVFNRFAFDSTRRPRTAEDLAPKAVRETGWPSADDVQPYSDPEYADAPSNEDLATFIRPYAWTGGRTKSNHQLELETLVSASDLCRTTDLERLEHHSIADLCQQPRSVAEVGAFLCVPLGVAKVLLGDMADLGLIIVHRTVQESGSSSHLMLMERVLSGLRRL